MPFIVCRQEVSKPGSQFFEKKDFGYRYFIHSYIYPAWTNITMHILPLRLSGDLILGNWMMRSGKKFLKILKRCPPKSLIVWFVSSG